MNIHRHRSLIFACALISSIVRAQDWPQWRGPERTGAISGGVHLIDAVPETGFAELWWSEPILDKNLHGQGSDVGYSSPIAVAGRVYLYLNQKVKDDSPFRLTWGILNRLGCFDSALPKELAAKVETARTSPPRTALPSDDVPPWASAWVASHLTHAQFVTLGAEIEDRLIRGAEAIDLRTLDKLAALRDKPYLDRADFEKALGVTGLAQPKIAAIVKELTANRKSARDVIFCFDATTGNTLWKKVYAGALFEYGTSSTPCLVNDRLYVSGGKTIYCLNAKNGDEIWQAPCPAKEVSSSPMVADGILLIQAGALCALDADNGKLLWTRPEFTGIHASPTIWRKDGKTYAVQNTGLVDLQTGNLCWIINGGGDPSPIVAGDLLVTCSGNGIMHCYRLATDKGEEIWALPGYGPGSSTPIIFQNHLYGTKAQNGPLFCVDMENGQVKWTSPNNGFATSAFNTVSCIIADGKLLLDGGAWGAGKPDLLIVRANPEKFELLGKGRLVNGSLRSATPTIADGRLFIRGVDALVCYDLRAK